MSDHQSLEAIVAEEASRSRLARIVDKFKIRYGEGSPRIFRAPGRVNLLGEHTDYNDGWVLPIAIDRDVTIAALPRQDRRVRLYSMDFQEAVEFSLDDIRKAEANHWSNYVRGVAEVLLKQGRALYGMDVVLDGNVPIASGLSSSAAMEVGFALTFQRLSGFEMSPVDMALSAQKAEHAFIGVKCGIMDQYISRMGRKDHALLIDCRSLEYRAISIPVSQAPGYVFVVGDTKVRRKLATSKYNERRAECEEAVRLLRPVLPGITALRDVSSSQLKQHMELLPANVLKRARHVVTEDERVMQAVETVHAGDLATFGRLMNDSHDSLRDDYEVSCDELNVIVNAARAAPGVLGSRMTGAGFGGCTVTLCEMDAVDNLISAVRGRYRAAFGVEPSIYACAAEDGAREISGPE